VSSFSLDGKRGLVLGVANRRSIAWGIAEAARAAGAELGFTYQGDKVRDKVEPLASSVGAALFEPCDITDDGQIERLFARIRERWDRLDFLVHSVAFARADDLQGSYTNTSRDGFLLAHEISSYSLTCLCRAAAPLMTEGGSVVTVSYLGGERVVPGYNVMGVAKASLEMSVRYLADSMGPAGIRVNAISAGPVSTLAARGISGFTGILKHVEERAPLRRNVTLEEIGATAAFLLSPAASAITGEVVHVDCGFHVLGF